MLGAGAGARQPGVATVILGGECGFRLIAGDGGLRRCDFGLLQEELSLVAGDRGAVRGGIGPGTFEGHQIVARIDHGENVALVDQLIFLDRHGGHVAVDLRGHHRGVGVDIGVIGRDEVLTDQKIFDQPDQQGNHDSAAGGQQQQPTKWMGRSRVG